MWINYDEHVWESISGGELKTKCKSNIHAVNRSHLLCTTRIS